MNSITSRYGELTEEQKSWKNQYKENMKAFPDYYIKNKKGTGKLGTIFTLQHKYLNNEINVFF